MLHYHETSAEDPNGAAMSIGMHRWRRRMKNIYKTTICGLPGEMPGYGGPFSTCSRPKI